MLYPMNFVKSLKNFIFLSQWEVKEFLSIPEEDIVYEVPSDDQLMTELVDIFKIAESSNS